MTNSKALSLRNLLLLSCCTVALGACGGGGGSSNDALPINDSPSDAETPTTPSTPSTGLSTGPDVAGSNFYANAANAALLNGPLVGGADNQKFAVRDIPFSVVNESTVLKVVSMTTAAIYPAILNGPFPGVIGVIENVSTEHQCFSGVVIDRIIASSTASVSDSFEDTGNTDIIGESAGYGAGAIQSCAAPGARYYFYDYSIQATSTADYESVEIGGIYTQGATPTDLGIPGVSNELTLSPPATAIPTSYQVNAEGNVDINIANQSDEAINSSLFGTTVIGLDASGLPVFASVEDGVGKLEPGAEDIVTLKLAADAYEGQSTSLRVVVSYVPSFF